MEQTSFDLKVSSEIFQNRVNGAVSDLNSVCAAAGDNLVIGNGKTMAEADLDHDRNKQLQERCAQKT